MTHAVADLVAMIRHPEGIGAGTASDILCYNHDLVATWMKMIGIEPEQEMDGIDLWPALSANGNGRDHVTVAWGPLVTVITDEWWYNANIWGEAPLLYAVQQDPNLEHDLAEQHPEVCEELRQMAVEDAGGEIPEAFAQYRDKPGCTPFLQ